MTCFQYLQPFVKKKQFNIPFFFLFPCVEFVWLNNLASQKACVCACTLKTHPWQTSSNIILWCTDSLLQNPFGNNHSLDRPDPAHYVWLKRRLTKQSQHVFCPPHTQAPVWCAKEEQSVDFLLGRGSSSPKCSQKWDGVQTQRPVITQNRWRSSPRAQRPHGETKGGLAVTFLRLCVRAYSVQTLSHDASSRLDDAGPWNNC